MKTVTDLHLRISVCYDMGNLVLISKILHGMLGCSVIIFFFLTNEVLNQCLLWHF